MDEEIRTISHAELFSESLIKDGLATELPLELLRQKISLKERKEIDMGTGWRDQAGEEQLLPIQD